MRPIWQQRLHMVDPCRLPCAQHTRGAAFLEAGFDAVRILVLGVRAGLLGDTEGDDVYRLAYYAGAQNKLGMCGCEGLASATILGLLGLLGYSSRTAHQTWRHAQLHSRHTTATCLSSTSRARKRVRSCPGLPTPPYTQTKQRPPIHPHPPTTHVPQALPLSFSPTWLSPPSFTSDSCCMKSQARPPFASSWPASPCMTHRWQRRPLRARRTRLAAQRHPSWWQCSRPTAQVREFLCLMLQQQEAKETKGM